MSSVVISGDTSGAVTLTVPAVAGTRTATLPAATGTVMVSGNMPAFSASSSNSQSFSSGTASKIQYNVEDFDTANCYDPTTNYRFTPTVAGYYQINVTATFASAIITSQVAVYKNGSVYMYGPFPNTASSQPTWTGMSCLVYCNGTSDYIEAYATVFGMSSTYQPTTEAKFQGVLIRTA